MYDIVVIGAGTAGMTAGLYAARGGMKVIVLEGEGYGGQIVVSPEVENYPGIPNISGYDFSEGLYKQMLDCGAEYKQANVTRIEGEFGSFKVYTDLEAFDAKTVILATGVKNRKLGLSNEEQMTGLGVSYCATCDGNFFRKKTVAVNGGGNTALEDAIFLSKICEKVYVIHRRNAFRGEEAYVKQLKALDNVEIMTPYTIDSINGTERVTSLTLNNAETNDKVDIDVNGLFVAIGQVPNNQAFADIVELDEAGYIKALEDTLTSKKGIYAAGDCRTKEVRQLATAAADGATAAYKAINDINLM
jgi:thioredoxin reductase (NADPH)